MSNSCDRLPQILYLLPQGVQLLPNIHDPVTQGGFGSVGCVLAGSYPDLVDALPRLATTIADEERSVAADEGEEHVVGVVPFADVDGERRPVAVSVR